MQGWENKPNPLTEVDEERSWQARVLGDHSPLSTPQHECCLQRLMQWCRTLVKTMQKFGW